MSDLVDLIAQDKFHETLDSIEVERKEKVVTTKHTVIKINDVIYDVDDLYEDLYALEDGDIYFPPSASNINVG